MENNTLKQAGSTITIFRKCTAKFRQHKKYVADSTYSLVATKVSNNGLK